MKTLKWLAIQKLRLLNILKNKSKSQRRWPVPSVLEQTHSISKQLVKLTLLVIWTKLQFCKTTRALWLWRTLITIRSPKSKFIKCNYCNMWINKSGRSGQPQASYKMIQMPSTTTPATIKSTKTINSLPSQTPKHNLKRGSKIRQPINGQKENISKVNLENTFCKTKIRKYKCLKKHKK